MRESLPSKPETPLLYQRSETQQLLQAGARRHSVGASSAWSPLALLTAAEPQQSGKRSSSCYW